MSIKNLWDLKSAKCFVCVSPMIHFLTELPLVTKSGYFMIILNDLSLVWSRWFLQTFSKAKVASAKYYGHNLVVCNRWYRLQLFRNKLEHYCRDLLQSIFRYACFLAKKRHVLVNRRGPILLHNIVRSQNAHRLGIRDFTTSSIFSCPFVCWL